VIVDQATAAALQDDIPLVTDVGRGSRSIPPLPHMRQWYVNSIFVISGCHRLDDTAFWLEPKTALDVAFHPSKIELYRDFGDAEPEELRYLAPR